MLLNDSSIKTLIDKLWDRLWSGGIANPITAIEQISYLLFMKRLDDIELKRERDAEFTGEFYISRFSGTYAVPGSREQVEKSTLRWSAFKHMPAEDMLLHVQTRVFPFLKELGDKESSFTKHMQNAYFIIPKPSLLVDAIEIIEAIYSEIERDAAEGGQSFQDIQGDVYEMLLSEIAQAGKNGQFRTPRHIIKLITELVEPQLGDRIADPACGTGGFLLGAYQYIVTDIVRKKDSSKLVTDEDGFQRTQLSSVMTEDVKTILQENLYGFDIDITMVRLGLMNLIMHGIDDPHIEYKDTLSKSYTEENFYNVVLANPPFTGNIDKGDINENLQLFTTKTELLFIERIFNMLKMGGTAGLIVPQGVLFGSSKAFIEARKKMVEEAELKAVITMPSGVFKPYAGVTTAILIFSKGNSTNKVWFYEMQSDGRSLDDKRSKLYKADKLRDTGDLQDIVEHYKRKDEQDTDRTAKHFFVSKEEIVVNNYDLNFSRYKEDIYEALNYEEPSNLIARLSELEELITTELKKIQEQIQ